MTYDSSDKTVTFKIIEDENGALAADGAPLVQTVQFTNHVHSFSYSGRGDTITATCSVAGCGLPDSSVTLKIVAPASHTEQDRWYTTARPLPPPWKGRMNSSPPPG